MNLASLPKTPPPTTLRVEEEEGEEDEPFSDIDPETLRELKRRSDVPQGQNMEGASAIKYSAKEDDAVAKTNQKNLPVNPEPLAPNPIQSFTGVNDLDQLDGFLHTPPDTNMAAGPNHVMTVVNTLFAIYSKSGTLLNKTSLSSWFGNVCSGCSVFDPRIAYDSGAGRWIMIALYKDTTSQSKLLLSISQTSDAMGNWWNYSLDAALNYSGENTWADYPDVGFDGISAASGGAIYVTVNQFTFSASSFRTALLFILPKSGLYAGGSISYWRSWDRRNSDNSQAFTYRASKTYGNPGGEFLINTENNGSSVSVWRVNPTYPPTAVDWTLQTTVNVGSYSIAPSASQPGTTDLIDTLDNRMYNAVWQNNRIYAAFTEAHNWGSGTVASLRYLKINTSSNTAEINETFGADGLHYYSPAIATDSSDNIVLVFSRSNASEYAGARYTGRLTTDTGAQGSAQLKAGTATLSKRSGTSSNRWGDYQGAAVDPSDGSKVWIYGEWAVSLSGVSNDFNWGTWIGQVQFPGTTPTPPSAPTANAATSVTSSSFTANWSSSSGATGYRLDVSTSSTFGSYVSGYQDLDVGNVLSRSVTGLNSNTTYYYRVRAYNSGGTSGNSNTISLTTSTTGSGFIINATFDSSITSNANSAAIQAMVNQAIVLYQSMFKDPVTVSILFRYSTTGPNGSPLGSGTLAQSNYVIYTGTSWNTYINALNADAKSANDTTANASLPASALSTNIVVSSANGRVVALNTPPAMFADGSVGVGGPYDGIVTLNSSQPFQFTRPPAGSNYDSLRSTEHEIDEVLGLGSYLPSGGNLRPQDLFSWSAPGTRNLSSSGSRYFSINSGSTNLVGFNQTPGGDFGDWLSGSCPQANPYVQNAFSCPGQYSDIAANSPEGINLDVIGYDLTSNPPPAPTANAATNVTGSSFTANWSSSSGATGYRLDVSTNSSFSSYVSGYQDLDVGNVLSRSVTGLSAGTTYYYRVRAYNSGGTSGNSNTISLTTTSPPRIDNVTPKAGRAAGGQQITLTGEFAGLSTVTIGGVSVSWSYTNGTSAIAFTSPAHAVGAVDITLTFASGGPLTKSNAFAYLPTVFTDDTLFVGVTIAKAQHIIELRQAVDAMRAVAGLQPAPWTDVTLTPTSIFIKAVHIQELRTYLDDAASRLGYSTSPYTDPSLTTGFVVKRIHIEELRQRIRVIAG
ncbi:MAG: NF038122 family metalloprotease [Pyrinomonadaceae bacterium]